MTKLYNTRIAEITAHDQDAIRVRFVDGTSGIINITEKIRPPTQWGVNIEQNNPQPSTPPMWNAEGLTKPSAKVDEHEIVWTGSIRNIPTTVWLLSDAAYADINRLQQIDMYPEDYARRIEDASVCEKYRVYLHFMDRTEGVLDLMDFAGRGIFKQWDQQGPWQWDLMRITTDQDTIEWGPIDDPSKMIDFCPEMVYSRVSGLSRDFPESARFAEDSRRKLVNRSQL